MSRGQLVVICSTSSSSCRPFQARPHRLQHLSSALRVAKNLQLCLVAFQQLLLLLVQTPAIAAATCSNRFDRLLDDAAGQETGAGSSSRARQAGICPTLAHTTMSVASLALITNSTV